MLSQHHVHAPAPSHSELRLRVIDHIAGSQDHQSYLSHSSHVACSLSHVFLRRVLSHRFRATDMLGVEVYTGALTRLILVGRVV